MSLNPDIRDQAYQFFIEEARELLQVLETGLLELRQDRSTPKVHELMRAAHSIKGGAASVDLSTIGLLAHRLEDFFKALYSDEVDFDTELESLLLQGYDCLSHPLLEQIEAGNFDEEEALLKAEPVFAALEVRLAEALKNADNYIPSSNDLGVDIVSSIFEVDVVQALDHLQAVVQNLNSYDPATELETTLEMFMGFAELFDLDGFTEIVQTAQAALQSQPERAIAIIEATVADCTQATEQVLAGDRERGGTVSSALQELALASTGDSNMPDSAIAVADESIWSSTALADDLFGAVSTADSAVSDPNDELDADDLWSTFASEDVAEELADNAAKVEQIDNIFESISVGTDSERSTLDADSVWSDVINSESSIEEIFGTVADEPVELTSDADNLWSDLPSSEPLAEEIFGTVADEPVEPTPQVVAEAKADPESELAATVESIADVFASLPPAEAASFSTAAESQPQVKALKAPPVTEPKAAAKLSVRVDLDRLERMNNLVGELTINRNSLALQNEQLQQNVGELEQKFWRFRGVTKQLQEISDQMLLEARSRNPVSLSQEQTVGNIEAEFDALEMDSYSQLYSSLQVVIEEMVQLEESVEDITIFAQQSDRTIDAQRQMLGQVRDELMWVRMLPLERILQRFPRTLRDLSSKYHKPVDLKLKGTGVLVDKAVLEKLSDPLLHLLRNGFDHGIEEPAARTRRGKSATGSIEIQAYYQGNQTVIEVKDDGKGLDLERIKQKGIEQGLISAQSAAIASEQQLWELIFEPGFSTASKVSEISGRGVGMNIVRSQVETLKGKISVTSIPGLGSTFTLRLPLTLTIAKLLVCSLGATTFAIPSDSVEEIIIPDPSQIKLANGQKFLFLDGRLVPVYALQEFLTYNCPVPDTDSNSKAFKTIAPPEDWAAPLLILRRGQQMHALEVVSLLSEQELVIKPYGKAIAAPLYSYGCTILSDGSLIPAFDGSALVGAILGEEQPTLGSVTDLGIEAAIADDDMVKEIEPENKLTALKTIMIVDDSTALRRTMALTLEKEGYRVVQKKDGKEALDGFKQHPELDLIICDVEMPVMNGFEFLGMRRRDSSLAQVPTFMLTSRSGAKHRNLAKQLGADGYFTKPYVEQDFIREVRNILAQDSKPAKDAIELQEIAIKTKTILVIDDSSALRRTLALSLEQKGYRVLQGRDGNEGLEQLRSNLQTDLVICDIEMPNVNGFEFLTLRRQEPNLTEIPVVMLTSRSSDKHRTLATSLGAAGFFTKPYVEERFMAEIEQYIY